MLMVSEKVLTDSRDSYEKQKNERKASLLRAEVRYLDLFYTSIR